MHNFMELDKLVFEEISIFTKLDICCASQYDIRNQRPRLGRNTLIFVEKGVKGVPPYYNIIIIITPPLLFIYF
jgi:hypothetical protein